MEKKIRAYFIVNQFIFLLPPEICAHFIIQISVWIQQLGYVSSTVEVHKVRVTTDFLLLRQLRVLERRP